MSVREIIAAALETLPIECLRDRETADRFVKEVLEKAGPLHKAQAIRRLKAFAYCHRLSFDVPAILIAPRPPEPRRREDWAVLASLVLAAHEKLDMALANRRGTTEAFAARALASAILRAGAWRPETWPALLRAITSGQGFCRSPLMGDRIWLTIRIPRQTRRVAQDDSHETIRFFFDVITLSLIGRAKGAQVSFASQDACLRFAMDEIGATGLTPPVICAAGFAALEDQADQSIPGVVFEVARGAVVAFSATEVVWRRMMSGTVARLRSSEPRNAIRPKLQKVSLDVSLSIARLHAALFAQVAGMAKPTRAPIHTALFALLAMQPVPIIQGLGLWLISLLDDRRAVNTLRRYGAALARLLGNSFQERDPASMTAGEIEWLIEDALELIPRRERIYRAARIAQFLQFAAQDPRLGWPAADLDIEGGASPRVRTALVAPFQINAALKAFSSDRVYQAAVLLGARGGLRLSDMEAMRVGDVDLTAEGMVMIHQTRWGDLKSPSARRMVALNLFLTATEKKIWRDFMEFRKREVGSNDAPLLASGGGLLRVVLFDRRRFADGLSDIGLRPHDLRHGALSNIALTLLAPPSPELRGLTGWGERQQAEMKAWLCRRDPLRGMRALARLAGHRDPATTLESYIHLTDLALGLHLSAAEARLAPAELTRILGLNRKSLPRGKPTTVEALRHVIVQRIDTEVIEGRPSVSAAPTLPTPPAEMTVELLLRIEHQIVKGGTALQIAQMHGLGVSVVNILLACDRIGHLKSVKDRAAARDIAQRVLSATEPEAWAETTLRASREAISFGAPERAEQWCRPVYRTLSLRTGLTATDPTRWKAWLHGTVSHGCRDRLQIAPIAPSGANGMRLLQVAARIVRAVRKANVRLTAQPNP